MILDVLSNASRYFPLNKGFKKAFEFLNRPDLKELSVGKYTIDGNRIYAIVAKEQGRSKEDAQLETHDKYIDIQLVLSGTDTMGWKPRLLCHQLSKEYNQTTDLQFFADEPDLWLAIKSGSFALFFPEDAHMPLISSEKIHKVIVKIAVDQ
ncbi:MAG: YhcH/YjgK/YiaL family protein [Pseudomonadota bacterium]